MKKHLWKLSLFTFLADTSMQAAGQIRLPAVLGSHMVLQQKSEVKLWGWCDPAEKIQVSTGWDTARYNTLGSADARWSVDVKTPAAGGPYTITIKGSNTVVIDDVLIGEVWVCSGQSNMEMSVNWGLPYADEAAQATNKNIRFFHIPRTTSAFPQDDVKAQWVVCDPENMKRFSAVGYFFGKKLTQELNVPVGLINASWGGTPAEVWTPKEIVEGDTALEKASTKLQPAGGWPIHSGLAYNAMISPLTNFNIAGTIWYQGESNTGTASTYTTLFTNMINAWRTAWKKDFPFYFVQIAPYANYGNKNVGALLREAQTNTLHYPNTGMVVISDLVNDVKDIHPKMKKEVGLRLANYALAETYGKKDLMHKSPVYTGMKVEKDKIRVYFDNAEMGFITKTGAPTEFYIAGQDRNFLPAEAKTENNTVIVSNKTIKNPVAVRFGFSNAAMPNLFSKDGLPVNLFRTDNWPVDTGALGK